MASQMTLYETLDMTESGEVKKNYIVDSFSANSLCPEEARQSLEKRYERILEITDKFDRRSVSYQLSKKDVLHSWLKYREGFSANLVNTLLDEMKIIPGNIVMDPFMGSGTTALVCQMRGIHSIGYDIMPISKIAIAAKSNIMMYDIEELKMMINEFHQLTMPEYYSQKTPYITITNSAYPEFNEKFLAYAKQWIDKSSYSSIAKNLFTLCVVNSLERCSFTSKTGQYLSWDSRSIKVIEANIKREKEGRKLLSQHYCRKTVENIQDAISEELKRVLTDIIAMRTNGNFESTANIYFKQSSALFELPKVKSYSLNGVITSPPYCNRYDYTRTYALELVYLGIDEDSIKKMRQSLLSCTVENKSKANMLKDYYAKIGASDRFSHIYHKLNENEAFQEVIEALKKRKNNGDLNNNGVIRMVEGYFTELAFIYAELYRSCKKGATVVFVNDNVRYGGEVIPVDYISTNLAEQYGFIPVKIYCLKQQKGNSSQQMKKYGRIALRKSITVWKKE